MAHAQQETRGERRERRGVAVLLTWVAGFVDGVGYLVLWQMFTAHMSGNTIAGAVHLGCERWGEGLHRLFPIPVFVAGVACGRGLVVLLARRGVRSLFAPAFALEAVLLSVFLVCGVGLFEDGGIRTDTPSVFYLVAALPALAMGVQNATLRRAGGTTVRTTFITGGLTDLTEEAVDYLCWRGEGRRESGTSPGRRRPSLVRIATLLALWLGYLLGGIVGAVTEQRWQLPTLLAPIAALLGLALLDLLWPFASAEEAATAGA